MPRKSPDLHDLTANIATCPHPGRVMALALTLRDRLRRALALAGDAIGPDFAISGHAEADDCGTNHRLAWSATPEVIEIRLIHFCRTERSDIPPSVIVLRDTWPRQQHWLN